MSDIQKFGDTSMATWMIELVTSVAREVNGHDQFDFNLMYRLVQAEPKRAEEAIQLWAQDLNQELNGQAVETADGPTGTKVMLVGGLTMCLDIAGRRAGAPQSSKGWSERVSWMMSMHPIVYDCLNHVSSQLKFPK